MPYKKTIVCLANSRKMSGRCLAGKEVDKNQAFTNWIRPVSDRDSQEISEEERRFKNGTDPKLLDIIQIEMRAPQPHGHQSENHLIDSTQDWVRLGNVDWKGIQKAIDHADTLWVNGSHSYNGLNDRVPDGQAANIKGSLLLIKPENLTLSVAVEGGQFRKRKVRGQFEYKRERYIVAVTDPAIERKFLLKDDGEYKVEEALLCVSLGEAYQGYCYKLIAAVITPEALR
jgi:putative nucleic acid modification protein with dual OB domain